MTQKTKPQPFFRIETLDEVKFLLDRNIIKFTTGNRIARTEFRKYIFAVSVFGLPFKTLNKRSVAKFEAGSKGIYKAINNDIPKLSYFKQVLLFVAVQIARRKKRFDAEVGLFDRSDVDKLNEHLRLDVGSELHRRHAVGVAFSLENLTAESHVRIFSDERLAMICDSFEKKESLEEDLR